MKITIKNDVKHVIILDVFGIYAQIYDQGFFDATTVEDIKKRYADTKYWRILIL